MSATREEIASVIQTVKAVADVIRELGSVPSGHLYNQVMGHMSLQVYTSIIDTLKRANLVKESNHVLTWTGPAWGTA